MVPEATAPDAALLGGADARQPAAVRDRLVDVLAGDRFPPSVREKPDMSGFLRTDPWPGAAPTKPVEVRPGTRPRTPGGRAYRFPPRPGGWSQRAGAGPSMNRGGSHHHRLHSATG